VISEPLPLLCGWHRQTADRLQTGACADTHSQQQAGAAAAGSMQQGHSLELAIPSSRPPRARVQQVSRSSRGLGSQAVAHPRPAAHTHVGRARGGA
jgi:hypothetical protein